MEVNMNSQLIDQISSTSKTALLTIYAHSIESQSEQPILSDPTAVELTKALSEPFSRSEVRLFRKLADNKLNRQLVYHIALRAKKYDTYADAFVKDHPDGTIINLGCGLDARYHRLAQKPKLFLDIDLEPMIAIKRELVEETKEYRMIGQSIFDSAWLEEVRHLEGPKLFIAEGLFMYLSPDELNPWLMRLADDFSGSYLLFETVVEKYTRGFNKKMVEFKLRKEFGVSGDVSYHFGLKQSDDLESLSPHFKLIEDWSYFDENHPKVGLLNLMGKIKSLRYVQWTVFYRIE